jgi:hypothetical protein
MKKVTIILGLVAVLGMALITQEHDSTVRYYIKEMVGVKDYELLETIYDADDETFDELLDNDRLAIVLKSHVYILDSLQNGAVRVRVENTKIIFWTYGKYLKKAKK